MDGENVQAQQFEGESKTDESAISISRSLPNRNTSARTNKKHIGLIILFRNTQMYI